jgi:hypothetical protein
LTSAQEPQTVTNILQQVFEPNGAPNFARFLLHARHIAKFPHSRIPRFFRRHPARGVVRRLSLDVFADVLLEIVKSVLAAPHNVPSRFVMCSNVRAPARVNSRDAPSLVGG